MAEILLDWRRRPFEKGPYERYGIIGSPGANYKEEFLFITRLKLTVARLEPNRCDGALSTAQSVTWGTTRPAVA
jgi:hypothetical protein